MIFLYSSLVSQNKSKVLAQKSQSCSYSGTTVTPKTRTTTNARTITIYQITPALQYAAVDRSL